MVKVIGANVDGIMRREVTLLTSNESLEIVVFAEINGRTLCFLIFLIIFIFSNIYIASLSMFSGIFQSFSFPPIFALAVCLSLVYIFKYTAFPAVFTWTVFYGF